MKKPSWLKKDFLNKPWKYPIKTEYGVLDTYNFIINLDKGPLENRKAMNWIDEQMKKEKL